jgi:hypothetical protein
MECEKFPCGSCGHVTLGICARKAGSTVPADVITWALLPYASGFN